MILGIKTVDPDTVKKLAMLREAGPDLGLVLLFAVCDSQGIRALREFSMSSTGGCAYVLKHTIDTAEQLTQVINSVAEGRVIVDPMIMEGLIRGGEDQSEFLNQLSPRELEVLSWMAKGYRNDTIAAVLSRDVKTVERHINNIYGKLNGSSDDVVDGDSRHPRVRATLAYLDATGQLPSGHFMNE